MDIRDYDNIYKYKFFLPMLYVVNWALMLTGPFFYPAAYKIYCFSIFVFMGMKGIQSIIWNIIATIKSHRLLNKAKRLNERKAAAKEVQ
jgi:hypothetical protein